MKNFLDYLKHLYIKSDGGETGIRTQERVAPLPVFKTGAFNRSAIHPQIDIRIFRLQGKFFFDFIKFLYGSFLIICI